MVILQPFAASLNAQVDYSLMMPRTYVQALAQEPTPSQILVQVLVLRNVPHSTTEMWQPVLVSANVPLAFSESNQKGPVWPLAQLITSQTQLADSVRVAAMQVSLWTSP